jgi:hypothetical protein
MATRYLALLQVTERLAGLDGLGGLMEAVCRDCLAALDLPDGTVHGGTLQTAKGSVSVRVERPGEARARWELSLERPDGRRVGVRIAQAAGGCEVFLEERASPRAALESRPEVADALLSAYVAQAGPDRLDNQPWVVGAGDIPRFVGRLLAPDRAVPFVTVSCIAGSTETMLDARALANRVAGLASVVLLRDTDATWAFAAALTSAESGQRWDPADFAATRGQRHLFGCYNGGVRLYRAPLTFGDDIHSHQLWLGSTVRGNAASIGRAVFDALCWDALQNVPASGAAWRENGRRDAPVAPTTTSARTPEGTRIEPDDILARLRRLGVLRDPPDPATTVRHEPAEPVGVRDAAAPSTTPADPGATAPVAPPVDAPAPVHATREDDDIAHLLELLAESEQRNAAQDEVIRQLERRLDLVDYHVSVLQARVFDAEPVGAAEADDDPDELVTMLDAVHAAERECPRLVFLDSARESAKHSPYQRPDVALRAFRAMDDVAKQRAAGPLGRGIVATFKSLGIEFTADESDTMKGEGYRSQFEFLYRGDKVFMGAHIVLGTGFDPQFCARIHCHWDEERRLWAIGWAGRHLRNTRS